LSPEIYQHIEKMLLKQSFFDAVLEIGADGSENDLIKMRCLSSARLRIGLGEGCKNFEGEIQYIARNANDLSCFKDNSFDLILCNSMFEHDPYFWKTLLEVKRVLAPGGRLIIGVPMYGEMGIRSFFPKNRTLSKLFKWFLNLLALDYLKASTPVLGIHNYPEDYYRFSKIAVRDVLLEGYHSVEIYQLMMPPRIIASGVK